jgi:hypothetical protein
MRTLEVMRTVSPRFLTPLANSWNAGTFVIVQLHFAMKIGKLVAVVSRTVFRHVSKILRTAPMSFINVFQTTRTTKMKSTASSPSVLSPRNASRRLWG